MKSSISFSSKKAFSLCLTFALCACGMAAAVPQCHAGADAAPFLRLAVLPVNNLSNAGAPLKPIQRGLSAGLKSAGLEIADDATLEKVMAQHRMRYTGGVTARTAKVLRDEAGTDAVLITSVELYLPENPPKIALTARLVTTDSLEIKWMDSVALAGDDAPGLLDLGMIYDPQKLQEKAVRQLAASLAGYLAGDGRSRRADGAERAFRPKTVFSGKELFSVARSRVAVVPFFNESPRFRAGEILLLHFLKQLVAAGTMQVVEPGAVRERMLEQRIIMNDGISNWDLTLIGIPLKIDYFVTGKIFEYGDYPGPFVNPKNDFSATLVALNTKKTVWASSSYNSGDDAVYLFDLGRVSTASALADKMVSAITRHMLGTR